MLTPIQEQLKQRLYQLESRVSAINDDVSYKNQPLSADWAEQAVQRENEEVLEALGNASLLEINKIKQALKRIEQGIYNQCTLCGEEINQDRLKLLISTDRCTQCAEEMESNESYRR